MLSMVGLLEPELNLCAEEVLLPYKWLTHYSKYKCSVQLDIQRNNGANRFDETAYSERDHKTLQDLISPAPKFVSLAEFVWP